MGQSRHFLAGLLGLAAIFCGCATNRPGNPFAATDGKSAADKKQAGEDRTVADGKNAPRAGSNEKTSLTAAGSDGGRPGSAAGDTASARPAKIDGHDPATLAYIEQELRDATPEERATQLSNLKGLHPEAVRQILRSRRMALRSVEKQHEQELAAKRANTYNQGEIQTVAGEAPAPDAANQRRGNVGEGLGTVSAWSRQSADNRTAMQPAAAQTTDKTNWPQNAPGPTPAQGAGQPPVGHSAGFRVDPQADGRAAAGFAAVRQGPAPSTAPAGSSSSSPGQSAPGQYNVVPAGGASTAPPRSSALNKAAVAVATPMSTGQVGPTAANGASLESSAAGGPAREQLTRLISAAEAEAFEIQSGETEPEKQAYIEKQVYLRMLYLMSGQQERAVQAIPGLEPADQEFWQQTFWGLTNYFDASSMPSAADRAAQTVTQMTNAVLRLQEKAKLELRNVTFCHKISSFGNYEKYARDEFSPGQEVLLYAEVANIHSEPITDGKFKTNLKSTIEIYRHGTQGELLDRFDFPETVDICRTHRRDYFHSYQLTIPAKLALGPHVLKLSVEDQLSRRVGTYSLNFMVK
jgi:hypothetical protein